MYVLPKILDLDKHFSSTRGALLLNDLLLSKSDPNSIISMLCDTSNDLTDSVASCECGGLSGNYYIGSKCKECGSQCSRSLFGGVSNDTWVGVPKTIKAVLNPQVYIILSRWMGTIDKIGVLSAILDMGAPAVPITGTPFFTSGGFNWFYDNFDIVITYFLDNHPVKSRRGQSDIIKEFLYNAGSAIWCTKLPIISRILLPITKASDSVKYVDPDSKSLMTAIFTLKSVLLSEMMMKFRIDHVEKSFYLVYSEFISYVMNIQTNRLPKKPDVFRKHVYGSRFHCSGRSVIVPIISPHRSDDVYLPWKLGVMMYRYHILSVLINKYNMLTLDAYDRVSRAVVVYDHDIDLIMQSLIAECPYHGLPILLNRNPSLKIAAIQLLFVVKIKPALLLNPIPSIIQDDENVDLGIWGGQDDRGSTVKMSVDDGTIEISPLVIKGPNID